MSLVAPTVLTMPVPVTVNTPVLASYVAEVMVGVVTLDTVTALPVRSAVVVLVASQLAAPARLNVVVSTADVPFWLSMPLMLSLSAALSGAGGGGGRGAGAGGRGGGGGPPGPRGD